MKRSSATTSFQFLAAVASAESLAVMSARCSSSAYRGGGRRGGRNQFRRVGFSDRRQYSGGRGHEQFVSGDSHVASIHEANLGIRQSAPAELPPSQPPYNPNHQFRRPPPPNYHHQFRQSPPFRQNTHGFRPAQQFRPPPPKQLNYRGWQCSKTAPLPNSEKFIVLSYNILADYLAIDHRSKLYYHIPRKMLDWEWRKRSILFELGLWSADIMCFQEVDRFKDLEDQLMLQGYSGIWKMRTGNAVDGCAIFWRTTRFKLLYEESIEFNKVGLRDNVAQICVLEHLSNNNCSSNTSALPTSLAGLDKVVICNIHVLYNPKRGEIKLGQVRMLLDRAYAVSKMWNAPVVLCGDFNCTPKSPLYNFISENKLDLLGVDRDKVSGQASAGIRSPRQINQNYNPNRNTGTHSSDNSIQAPLVIGSKLDSSLLDVQKQHIPDKSDENVPATNNSSQPKVIRNMLAASDESTVLQSGGKDSSTHMEETKEIQENVVNSCQSGTEPTVSALIDSFEENLTVSHSKSESESESESKLIHKSTTTVTSHSKGMYHDKQEMEQTKSAHLSDQGYCCENSHSNIREENKGPSIKNHAQPIEGSPLESSKFPSSHAIVNDENSYLSPASQANTSSRLTRLHDEGEEKPDDASLGELNDIQLESGMVCEDQSAFLSALHGEEDSFRTYSGQIRQLDLAHSRNEYASDPVGPKVHSLSNEVIDDVPLDLDSEAVDVEKTAYDPSLWTPMEIATATGNVDCTVLEHLLKLKSAYAEVEDFSGTRDPNGEPLVTSYNRCFLGTVDYIWKSEGLQTIRVLAPIPKHAMQWTPGFPTRKWGSDHIALASEFAFIKDVTNDATDNDIKVQQHKERRWCFEMLSH